MSSPRKSAAIVLTRGHGTEVFLALRSPRLRFFGGFHAFPGGVIDPSDLEDEGGGATAFARCAVRELFEETGVRLAGSSDGTDRNELRRGLISEDDIERERAAAQWRQSVAGCESQIDGALETVLEITTPPFAPRRYETEFFHAELPDGETPEIWEGELVGGEFIDAAIALERWRSGEILIAPPVLLVLGLLEEHGFAGFAAAARAEGDALRAGKLHPICFSPGIFVAPLEAKTKPPATTTNCFLVGQERVYVVDPATTEVDEQARLFEKIDRVIAAGSTIAAVLVTHSHPDHIGAVSETASRYDVPVGGHRDALPVLDLVEGVKTFSIADGDVFDLGTAPDGSGEWTLRALYTPGHSKDHLAFMESRYASCIVGDLLSAVSTVLIDPPEGHLGTYLETLERLHGESVSMVYPSHGPAVHTGPKMIQHFIRHRTDRVQQICAAIESGVREEVDLVRLVYHDLSAELMPLAARSLAASLEYLTEQERAHQRADGTWHTGSVGRSARPTTN